MEAYEIKALVEKMGLKKFRASQITSWLYKNPVLDIDSMSNVPLQDRKMLKEKADISGLSLVKKTDSSERHTSKYLFKAHDGALIETVKIGSGDKITICVSSQSGCALGCLFCATGANGFFRDLSTAEIIGQVTYLISTEKIKINNIVFMGMGEPLLNYENVIKAIRIMNSPDSMGIGIRRITVSTCGLPKQIRKIAGEGMDFNLAVSLNAPNNQERSDLMPINRKFPIEELMKAVDHYIQKTNRRVTFEYILIRGENDSIKDARELAELLSGKLCHVNLISFNRVKGCDFAPASGERINLFYQILANSGVNVTIRKSKGSDIAAACGQLAGACAK